ncbi:MAG TPA: L-aspartate oxidase, partial [Candidatus Thalassarchaeaceae archaeon]|nr:L-aspartate oxidase [Candidatus Thalassarchaeaceae archaeon]
MAAGLSERNLPPADVAVIGSGIAGLFLALRCFRQGLTVVVVTKKELSTSSTNWAQGGIAGVLDVNDESALEAHVKDTLSSGAGLCDEEVVRSVVYEAADRIKDLVEHGVEFDLSANGLYDLAREGGHSDKRILHTKDRTGAEIERALTEEIAEEYNSGLRILENWMVLDLIRRDFTDPDKGVAGLWCMAPDGVVYTLAARTVVLASGGAGMLHLATTNPPVSTGDGVAMAHRVGADIEDMEFIQFHPTALAVDSEQPFLITEAMRGHGAILMTQNEYAEWRINPTPLAEASYMSKYSSKGSLDTRDIVARATDREMKESGDPHVLLVTEHLDSGELKDEFPTIAARVEDMGIRFGDEPIPVRPAAHYLVGGVSVDHCGRALRNGEPMPGLYAIGEVARTGLHGANRLASNSLLEAVVYSERAAEDISSRATNGKLLEIIENLTLWRDDDLDEFSSHPMLGTDLRALRSTMTNDVGLVKSDSRLSRARQRISEIRGEIVPLWHSTKPTQSMVEFRNLIICAELVTEASMARRENVGLH